MNKIAEPTTADECKREREKMAKKQTEEEQQNNSDSNNNNNKPATTHPNQPQAAAI